MEIFSLVLQSWFHLFEVGLKLIKICIKLGYENDNIEKGKYNFHLIHM